jgi:hypothetical protein
MIESMDDRKQVNVRADHETQFLWDELLERVPQELGLLSLSKPELFRLAVFALAEKHAGKLSARARKIIGAEK